MVTSNITQNVHQTNNQINGHIPGIDLENFTENEEHNYISRFYDGATIFVTGATGFLGKALVEKLLRSCAGVKYIYVLVRPKRGMNSENRLKDLTKSSVFDRIRDKRPEYFDKIKVMNGDVSQLNLGLSESDYNLLISTVNIVFHSAATVRFNENLKDAVNLNTWGTKRIVDLCKQIKNLQSFIHVSTAYSNPDKKTVDEVVYPAPFDPETIMQCVAHLPLDTLSLLTQKILGKHPNTYTFTKAMAEEIVGDSFKSLPCAIVRPSIVVGAWKEPFPGWVDNIAGVTGIIMECGRGNVKSVICDGSLVGDLVPVDVVVNTLIAAAWQAAVHKGSTIKVYNCTTGSTNPLKWDDFAKLAQKYARESPTKYLSWYPSFRFRTNRVLHALYHVFTHVLPAFVWDILLYLTKHKPIMMRLCKKIDRMARSGEFFVLNEWSFLTGSLSELGHQVSAAADGAEFPVDVGGGSAFTWDDYMRSYMLGIRKFVLKDEEGSVKAARAKMNRFYWTQKLIQIASLYVAFKMVR